MLEISDMETIKNIIFDLGGVIIDIKREAAATALQELGIEEAERLLGEYEQKGVFLLLEEGRLSDAEMYDSLLPLCNDGTTCTDIKTAFEKFLVAIPVERLRKLDSLRKKGYKLYVCSNTNPIFYNDWIAKAFRQDGKTINDYFDGIVASFQELMCKPNPDIFKILIERYGLKPEETIFLDDSAANCASASSLGIHSKVITEQGEDSFDSVTTKLEAGTVPSFL